jgi:hypothetical protein
LVTSFKDIIIVSIQVVGIEGGVAFNEIVHEQAQSPNINFETVLVVVAKALLLVHNFGRHIIRRSAKTPSTLAFTDLNGQAEVANFELHLVGDEDVPRLKIPVHNPFGMHVLHRRDQLLHKVPGFKLGEIAPFSDQVAETLVPAVFKQDVYVGIIFEEMFKLNYIPVVQRLLKGDLKLELLLAVEWFKRVLRNHFAGEYRLRGAHFNQFVATCKAALAEQLSFYVLLAWELCDELAVVVFADLNLGC